MIYINRFFGRSIQFPNGLSIGFNWMHGNGESSRTIATLASYHPPSSITWIWALRWSRPKRIFRLPSIHKFGPGRRGAGVILPFIGMIWLDRQERMERKS